MDEENKTKPVAEASVTAVMEFKKLFNNTVSLDTVNFFLEKQQVSKSPLNFALCKTIQLYSPSNQSIDIINLLLRFNQIF
jgi:hypothetical protein